MLYLVKQPNHILLKQHSHCTPSLTTLVRDWLPCCIASVRCPLL